MYSDCCPRYTRNVSSMYNSYILQDIHITHTIGKDILDPTIKDMLIKFYEYPAINFSLTPAKIAHKRLC